MSNPSISTISYISYVYFCFRNSSDKVASLYHPFFFQIRLEPDQNILGVCSNPEQKTTYKLCLCYAYGPREQSLSRDIVFTNRLTLKVLENEHMEPISNCRLKVIIVFSKIFDNFQNPNGLS